MHTAHVKMAWRSTNKTLQILEAAEKGRYGILAAIALERSRRN